MNTPPSLDQLRDIHLPDPSGTGLDPAAVTLLALILGALALCLALALRRRARHQPLREAVRELDELINTHARTADDVALTRGIARLVRNYAVWRFPATPCAGLTGDAWLAFLDAHGGKGAFSQGIGRALATLPYVPQDHAHPPLDASALAQVVRHWLRENRP